MFQIACRNPFGEHAGGRRPAQPFSVKYLSGAYDELWSMFQSYAINHQQLAKVKASL